MKYEISTDQLLRYLDGTLDRIEREQVCQALQTDPSLTQKLEGLAYLYEKYKGDGSAIRDLLFFQKKKVQDQLFYLSDRARKSGHYRTKADR